MGLMDITLRDNGGFDEVRKLLAGLPKGAETAISRAMNRTLDGARVELVRAVTADYLIKAGDVRETITISKASPSGLQARLSSRGSVLGLQHFQVTPKTTKPRPKVGVRVRVKRDSQASPIAGAFVAKRITGVYRRTGPGRLPIERLFGPAVPSMIGTELDGGIQDKVEDRLERELVHQAEFLLSGKSGR
jgi:hypothetical protein